MPLNKETNNGVEYHPPHIYIYIYIYKKKIIETKLIDTLHLFFLRLSYSISTLLKMLLKALNINYGKQRYLFSVSKV